MALQKYPRPPITEAIVDLRFNAGVDKELLGRFATELRRNYPTTEHIYKIVSSFQLTREDSEPRVDLKKTFQGQKLVSRDGTDVVLVYLNSLATVRLAPYEGWETLTAKVRANYEELKKVAGYRGFSRVATRYINRIDVPTDGRDNIDTSEYLIAEPRIPLSIPTINSFQVSFNGPVPSIGAKVIVNAAIVQSPLIDHVSLLLDIDLYKDSGLPQKDQEIWEVLETLRTEKNALFEHFVTDKARELFFRV